MNWQHDRRIIAVEGHGHTQLSVACDMVVEAAGSTPDSQYPHRLHQPSVLLRVGCTCISPHPRRRLRRKKFRIPTAALSQSSSVQFTSGRRRVLTGVRRRRSISISVIQASCRRVEGFVAKFSYGPGLRCELGVRLRSQIRCLLAYCRPDRGPSGKGKEKGKLQQIAPCPLRGID